MKSSTLLAGVALAVLTMNGTAHSATVTETFDFSLSNFVDVIGNQAPPANSITGSFTLTFDPTILAIDTNVGLTVNSFAGTSVSSPFAVSHGPLGISFGGSANGAGGMNLGTNDFVLQIIFLGGDYLHPQLALCSSPGINCGNFTGSSAVYASGYIVANRLAAFFATEADLTATATPLPAALPLFASALGFLGWAARRRKQRHVA